LAYFFIGFGYNELETAINKGLQKGLQQGKELGEKQAKIEIARNLLDVLDAETIAKKTGLSIEEIEAIK